MLRFISLLLLLFFSRAIFSQGFSSCQVVIGATGGKSVENGRRYAYTVGEAITGTLVSPMSGRTVTQGFHQPDVCLPVSTDQPELWLDWEVQVYPNPTVAYLQVQFSAPEETALAYRVFDQQGRCIISDQVLPSTGVQIQCDQWPSGTYVVQLRHPVTKALMSIPFVKI